MSDNILYLVTFTLKLAKHKMAPKMLRKHHILYSLSHIKAQFMVSERLLIHNFISWVFEKNWPLFDLYIQDIRCFFMYLVLL